jgi:hypothetical protein
VKSAEQADTPTATPRWFIPTGNWVLVLLAPCLVFIATSLQRAYLTDFWHHLARGRAIVTEGRLLNEDRFTFTVHGEPLQDANWLTQIVYYHLFQAGGLGLVQLVNSLVLAAMMAGLVYLCWRASGSLRVAGFLGVFAFLGLWQLLIIRPQSLSLLLFVLLYFALDASERRPWLLIFPPLILGLWANLHGGFPIGFLPIGCFFLAAAWDSLRVSSLGGMIRNSRTWALGLCLAASILATLANPYGWKVYEYIASVSQVAGGRPISEWQAPGTYQVIGKVFIVSILLVIVSFALSRRRPTTRDLVLVLCFLPLACGAMRMIAWWLIISLPIVAAQLAAAVPPQWLQDPEGDRPSFPSGVFCGFFLVLCLASLPGLPPSLSVAHWLGKEQRFEDDVEKIAQSLRGRPADNKRIYCSLEIGEYLGWALQPDGYTVFMDGRIEIIPDPIWADYWALLNARGDWQEILDKWRVNYLVLDESDPTQKVGLVPLVKKSSAWEEIERQGDVILFVRKTLLPKPGNPSD